MKILMDSEYVYLRVCLFQTYVGVASFHDSCFINSISSGGFKFTILFIKLLVDPEIFVHFS